MANVAAGMKSRLKTASKKGRKGSGGLIDPFSLLGIGAGAALVAVSVKNTSADPLLFLNIPGLLIVLGGVACATFISFPAHQVVRVFPALIRALRPNRQTVAEDIEQIVEVARAWLGGDLRRMEQEAHGIRSGILRIGLDWSLAGTSLSQVQTMMEWEHKRRKIEDQTEVDIVRAMAGYSPAFGMLGTLLGLINLLHDLDESLISELGANMALALITTLYGLVCANLLFIPLSVKLGIYFSERSRDRKLAIEAVRLINENVGPAEIRERLCGIAFGKNSLTGEGEDR